MWRLMLFLSEPVPPPSLTRLEAVDTTAVGRTPGAEYPIDFQQVWMLDGYSPTPEDDAALLEELLGWLQTIRGDFALVHDTWTPIVSRRAGAVELAAGYPQLKPLLRAA